MELEARLGKLSVDWSETWKAFSGAWSETWKALMEMELERGFFGAEG